MGKIKITKLEKRVLFNIINSNFMDVTGTDMIGEPIWSFSATNENKQLAGALGSLVKKGFCQCGEHEGSEVCMLTEAGYSLVIASGLLNMHKE